MFPNLEIRFGYKGGEQLCLGQAAIRSKRRRMAEPICKDCNIALTEEGSNEFQINCTNCRGNSCKFCYGPAHFPASCENTKEWYPIPSLSTEMNAAHLRVYKEVKKKMDQLLRRKERIKTFQGTHSQKLLKSNPELRVVINEMKRIVKIVKMSLIVQLANHAALSANEQFSQALDDCVEGLDLLMAKYPDRARRKVRGIFKYVPCVNEDDDVGLGPFELLGTRRFAAKRCRDLLRAVTHVYTSLNSDAQADVALIRTLISESRRWDQI